MPAKPSLEGPRAKVERANEHLAVLDADTAAFYEGTAAEGKPYEIRSEFRPDSSEYVFFIKVAREPPLRFGLLLGDFAHSLRCALDHLVCQLALLAGADCKTTQFPICSNPGEFRKREGNWLKGIDSRHRAAIEQAQPYNSGAPDRHALTILNWIDNVDKHRAVHPAFGYFFDPGRRGAAELRFVPNQAAGVIRYRKVANGRRVVGDTDIAVCKLAPVGPDPKVDMYGELAFEPAFGERWLGGHALEPISLHVAALTEKFAADFP